MSQVPREVHYGHASFAELTLDLVTAAESGFETVLETDQMPCHIPGHPVQRKDS